MQVYVALYIKQITQSHFMCIFVGEMRLDNFLYAYVYATIQGILYIKLLDQRTSNIMSPYLFT